jgi:hypothetical protein
VSLIKFPHNWAYNFESYYFVSLDIQSRTNMKKLILIAIALLFVGCGGGVEKKLEDLESSIIKSIKEIARDYSYGWGWNDYKWGYLTATGDEYSFSKRRKMGEPGNWLITAAHVADLSPSTPTIFNSEADMLRTLGELGWELVSTNMNTYIEYDGKNEGTRYIYFFKIKIAKPNNY